MGRETRRYPRFAVNLTGTLELLEEDGHGLAFGIELTDVSSGGLGLISGGPLPVGAQVSLSLNGGTLVGFVANCRPEYGHFAVGIQIDHDSGILSAIQWIASLRPAAHVAVDPTAV
jgi:hypothetical protein